MSSQKYLYNLGMHIWFRNFRAITYQSTNSSKFFIIILKIWTSLELWSDQNQRSALLAGIRCLIIWHKQHRWATKNRKKDASFLLLVLIWFSCGPFLTQNSSIPGLETKKGQLTTWFQKRQLKENVSFIFRRNEKINLYTKEEQLEKRGKRGNMGRRVYRQIAPQRRSPTRRAEERVRRRAAAA